MQWNKLGVKATSWINFKYVFWISVLFWLWIMCFWPKCTLRKLNVFFFWIFTFKPQFWKFWFSPVGSFLPTSNVNNLKFQSAELNLATSWTKSNFCLYFLILMLYENQQVLMLIVYKVVCYWEAEGLWLWGYCALLCYTNHYKWLLWTQ